MFPFSSFFAFTNLTYPSSVSGSSSIKAKILSAPASAITIELNCCATCINGCVKLFVNWRYDAMTPNVIPPIPSIANTPPNTAVNTNWRFPILPTTGPMIFAYLLAFAALSNRDSFNLSNSSSDLRSWLKTLTTLCPFILSSINPVTSANDFCWRIKYFPLFPPIAFVTVIMIPITTTARIVKIGLNTNIEINVTMIVKNDINAWGIAWLIICLNVSVSFVYKLIIEPFVFWSK